MIEWLTKGLVVLQFVFLGAKVFGFTDASLWLVFSPGIALLALLALALFMVSVVYND